jgi:PadR family transcriptional regulator, regulatory protein PadR
MSQTYLQQLLNGVVEPLVLFIISDLPIHGYRIARELEQRSNGYFKLTGSTVYSALRRLEKQGLVLSSWQQVAKKQKRRYYRLTEKGYRILAEKLSEWSKFSGATGQVINQSVKWN